MSSSRTRVAAFSRRSGASLLGLSSLLALAACGGAPPAPAAPAKPLAVATEPPPDVTAVPEPAGLVMVGRVSKPDAILRTVGTWTRLPLPGGADLVRSITDDAVGDAVDLSQPVDGAVALGGSKRDPKPLVAVSVAVRSFDDAKTKLGAKHKLTAGKNGQIFVAGIGRAATSRAAAQEEDEEEGEACVLAHAPAGGRLVCGEREALDTLSAYLTRTVPRKTWSSDVHLEMTLAAVREPLMQVRQGLPFLAKSILGTSSPALGQLIEATVAEVVDVVNDTDRMTLDATLAEGGAQATLKVDYARASSLVARLATSHPERASEPPPAAFWRLPGDTDLAAYGKGSDSQLFDHPRELLGNVALEATEGAGMPEAERKAVRDLVVDRMMGLFTGPLVYGKGYDAAAVEKALTARGAVKPGNLAALDEADRLLAEQAVGWHLVQVSEPITKVGPILKDWAQLWNRPAFAKWAKQQASRPLAQMRILPMPAGVTLPKEAVHLEIVMPRPDLEETPPAPQGAAPAPARPTAGATKPAAKPAPRGKRIPVKPLVLHLIAVPDQGGTWLGFGMDAKLLAQKAAASLATAPEGNTLGKAPRAEALRDGKANAAWLATLRGFLVFTAMDHRARSAFGMLGQLPAKGQTPIVLTFASQPPSGPAPGGSALATFQLPRAAIEDIVKLVMSSR